LVAEQKIDELRDLDVIDRDIRFGGRCDDQVLLVDALQV
jgi:hypothetical protein